MVGEAAGISVLLAHFQTCFIHQQAIKNVRGLTYCRWYILGGEWPIPIRDMGVDFQPWVIAVFCIDELATIAADEQPDEPGQPFGIKAREWIASKVEKGVDGVINVGGKVAKKELTEAFQDFYDKLGPSI